MPNYEVDEAREQIEILRKEIDEQREFYESIMKGMQDDKGVFEEYQREQYMQLTSNYQEVLT